MPSLSTSLSQVPLYNRYETLDVEGPSADVVHDGPSIPEVLPRSEDHNRCIKTTSMRKTRQVLVIGGSLLR